MLSYLQIEFSDGSVRLCNVRAHGPRSAENKAHIICNKLEKPGERELVRWEMFFNCHRPSLNGSCAVRSNYVAGPIYFGEWLRRHDNCLEDTDND